MGKCSRLNMKSVREKMHNSIKLNKKLDDAILHELMYLLRYMYLSLSLSIYISIYILYIYI